MTLPLAYISLSALITIVLIYFGYRSISHSNDPHKRRSTLQLVIGLAGFHAFIYLMADSGVLESYAFPPRFALFIILPAFIFTGLFFYTNRNKRWMLSIPSSWLFVFQSFRVLVESVFVMSVAKGALHKEVTIHGYNYDMIYAGSVLVIALLVYGLKVLPEKIVLAWNYLGLLVIASIIFLFQTTIYLPELYGASAPMMPLKAVAYPYILIAGFLMPSAVFIHVWNILQLRKQGIKLFG